MKKRILVTISISFAIRYLYRSGLLHFLQQQFDVVIALSWPQQDLMEELKSDGFEVVIIPNSEKSAAYFDVRKKIDIWFRSFRLKSSSSAIQQDYLDAMSPLKEVILRRSRQFYNRIMFSLPGYLQTQFKKESSLIETETNLNGFKDFVKNLRVDAVFTVTPFHAQEELLLRACKMLDKKMITSILSFDNITKRGFIPFTYDLYMVWNSINRNELHKIYPASRKKPVVVTGAVQFDFYKQKSYLLSKNNWRERVGIQACEKTKIILYSGGPARLLPQEPQYLKQLDEAISAKKIIGDPIILFRCHPMDKLERWQNFIKNPKNIVFDHSWESVGKSGYSNVTDADIQKLCSTLAYTDVHINICSTMVLDGNAFNKPQIGIAYHPSGKRLSMLLRNMYMQQHYKVIAESNAVHLAHSENDLYSLINDALINPEKYLDKSALSTVVTNIDGNNARRVADTIINFMHEAEIIISAEPSTVDLRQ